MSGTGTDPAKPLLANPEEDNKLTLEPGKLYQFIYRSNCQSYDHYLNLWKNCEQPRTGGDMYAITNLNPDKPFMFLTVHHHCNFNFTPAKGIYCGIKVIYEQYIGNLCICTHLLHTYLAPYPYIQQGLII